MMKQGSENERRKCNERRLANHGVPMGLNERRINIERRLFNLDVRCFSAWLEGVAENDSTDRVSPHL
jgi:hypothetical protein